MPYLAVFGIAFGINLLPAFGPPTWSVLVFTRLHWHLNPVALVLIGATAAASGRYLLALGARRFSTRLPQRMKQNLEEARVLLKRKRGSVFAIFAASALGAALPGCWVPRSEPSPVHAGILPRATRQLFDLRERGGAGGPTTGQRLGAVVRLAVVHRPAGRAPCDRLPAAARRLAPLPEARSPFLS